MEERGLWGSHAVYEDLEAGLSRAQSAQKLRIPLFGGCQPSTEDPVSEVIFGLQASDVTAPSKAMRQN
eukprot:scaffold444728_cov39-Prasinocladus_malaysianus.AAC.1